MVLFLELPAEIILKIIDAVFLADQATTYLDVGFLAPNIDIRLRSQNATKISTKSFTADIGTLTDIDSTFAFPDVHLRRGALLALALTNRLLASLATPVLFKMVELKRPERYSDAIGPVQRFMFTVARNEALASHVHSLSLSPLFRTSSSKFQVNKLAIEKIQRGDEPFQDLATRARSSDVKGPSTALDDYFAAIPLSRHYIKLFDLLPNLRVLKLDFSWIPIHLKFSWETSKLLSSSTLHNLTELALIESYGNYSYNITFYTVIRVLGLPRLKTLFLKRMLFTRIPDTQLMDKYCQPRQSSVSNLILDGVLFDELNFSAFIRLPRSLEKFSFTFGAPNFETRATGVDVILKCVQTYQPAIKSIVIRGNRDQRGEDDVSPTLSSLNGCLALEELGIPFELLRIPLAMHSEGQDITSTIPKNLRKLRLFMYDDVTMGEWVIAVETVFYAKQKVLLHLEELFVEVWLGDDDASSDGDSREPGVVWSRGKTISNLVEAGEAVGIKFEVTIDEYARSGKDSEYDG